MPKVTIEMDGITLVLTRSFRHPNPFWLADVSGDKSGLKELTDLQAAATAALAMGVEEPGLEKALYDATGNVWQGCEFSPIP